MELDIKAIESLVKLMIDNKLDKLKLGDLELTKSRYEIPKNNEQPQKLGINSLLDEDELLFFSTSAPHPTMDEQLNFANKKK